MSLPGRLIDVDGARTFVHRSGNGQPLVLIHGLLLSHWCFRKVIPALARHADVIAFDLPGHGESDRSVARGPQSRTLAGATQADYSPDGLADFVMRLFERLRVNRATVVGHSLGGAVAISLAARYPDSVRALAVADPVSLPFKLPLRGQLVVAPWVGEQLFHKVYNRSVLAAHLASAFFDKGQLEEEEIDYYWERLNRPGGRAAMHAVIRGMAGLDQSAYLARIEAPTWVLWGEHDQLVPPEHAQRIAAAIPGSADLSSSVHRVESCGHTPAEERPERFAELIGDFHARFGQAPRARTGQSPDWVAPASVRDSEPSGSL